MNPPSAGTGTRRRSVAPGWVIALAQAQRLVAEPATPPPGPQTEVRTPGICIAPLPREDDALRGAAADATDRGRPSHPVIRFAVAPAGIATMVAATTDKTRSRLTVRVPSTATRLARWCMDPTWPPRSSPRDRAAWSSNATPCVMKVKLSCRFGLIAAASIDSSRPSDTPPAERSRARGLGRPRARPRCSDSFQPGSHE